MPRRVRAVQLQTAPVSVSHEEAVQRIARATAILIRIAERVDAQKALAANPPDDNEGDDPEEPPPS